MNKIAVISTGNGGQAMAAYLALKGYSVSLYAREQERVDMFKSRTFVLRGFVNESAQVDLISCNMEQVIQDADMILVTTPAQYHFAVAKAMAPYLKNGQTVVLNPGRTFGTYEFDSVLKQSHCTAKILLAEADTFIFTCRCVRPGYPQIFEKKKSVKIAAHKKQYTKEICDKMNILFGGVQQAPSILHTGLSNIGAVLHPLPTLMNLTRIEAQEVFRYYIDGISPLVSNMLEELDRERMSIASALNVDIPSAKEWIEQRYDSHGDTLYESIQNNFAYSNVLAPIDIDTRYIHEDIKTGCVPMSCMAKALGLGSNIMDCAISWASIIYKHDFYKSGRNSEKIDMLKIIKDNT